MMDDMELIARSDAEQAAIMGGGFPWNGVPWWAVNNLGALVDGVKEGYADARA